MMFSGSPGKILRQPHIIFSPRRGMFYLLMSVFASSFVSKGSRKALV
jgi:hypothetical protein